MLNKFFGGNPELFTLVIDDLILIGVSVNSKGTGRGVEKVGEEVGYRYL